MFLTAPSSLIGHGGTIELPYVDRRFDQEAEFAFIIGKQARNVSRADALAYVFGYTGLLDITMRGGEDRSTTLEVGDVITTGTPAGVGAIVAGDHIEMHSAGSAN